MTLEELSNLSDDELNRMAAEKVMGWVFREEVCQDYPYHGETLRNWVDQGGKCQSAAADWSPALDRVQSLWLLKAMAARGADFQITIGAPGDEGNIIWKAGGKGNLWNMLLGDSPRSETIAALLAAFAMEGKDSA